MIRFLSDNLGTIAVSAVLAAIVLAIIIRLINNKRHGKSTCSCGCQNCPNSGACHNKS